MGPHKDDVNKLLQVGSGSPSPPTSPPLAATASALDSASTVTRARSGKGGAAHAIAEQCERLFCRALRAAFLGEGKQRLAGPLVIGASKSLASQKDQVNAFVIDDFDGGVDYDAITPGGSFLEEQLSGHVEVRRGIADRRESTDVRLEQAVRSAFGTSTPPLSESGFSMASSQLGNYMAGPAVKAAVRKDPKIMHYLEMWDYSGGARFRGFTATIPSSAKGAAVGKAIIIFFDQPVIGLDLKQGLMALIELASTPQLDCQRLIVCLERDDAIGTAQAEGRLLRDLRWVGFEAATLDEFASISDLDNDEGAATIRPPTSERWMLLGMDI